ncbi:PspC domain-containing protein [Kangiella sp. HZ709]|uniref:PspC domain-containing protein n=1 Tax=Kangiella sp. HZ709 TaxID=2666328 RepID=UPI0012B069D9|nr:PspC domain-containing protein [Kangiella sp. HZ709]MRX26630.1 PspC domain-containing protein [Kangiella sp. HZ709]
MSGLKRSKANKMIGGVCGGLAKRFDIDPTMMRIIYVIASLLTATVGAFLYIILWLVIPEE